MLPYTPILLSQALLGASDVTRAIQLATGIGPQTRENRLLLGALAECQSLAAYRTRPCCGARGRLRPSSLAYRQVKHCFSGRPWGNSVQWPNRTALPAEVGEGPDFSRTACTGRRRDSTSAPSRPLPRRPPEAAGGRTDALGFATRRGGRYNRWSRRYRPYRSTKPCPVPAETLNDLSYTGATAGPFAITDGDTGAQARKDDPRDTVG